MTCIYIIKTRPLKECVKQFDITVVVEEYSLLDIIRNSDVIPGNNEKIEY